MKKIVLFAFAAAATACGVQNNPVATTKAGGPKTVLKTLDGEHAESLFAALEDAGVTGDTVDSRLIVGATHLSAGSIRCSVIMNATQDRRCEFDKDGEVLEVRSEPVARKAVEALQSVNALARSAIGATNYDAKDLICSKAVGPQGFAHCELILTGDHERNPDGSMRIEGNEARDLFEALESTGWAADSLIDGIRVFGETQMSADYLHCTETTDRDFTKTCVFGKDGAEESEIASKSMRASLVKFLQKINAQVAPFAVGASQYRIAELKCRKIELAEPAYVCDYSKVY